MIPGQKLRVDGNKEVIQLLEYWLKLAEEGTIDFMAVIASRGPCDSTSGFAGVQGREAIINFAVDSLKMQIMGDFINRMNPPSNKGVTADKWAFNISRGPCSYDFIAWLINAEMTRRREGAPAPLKIAFYVGQNGSVDDALHSPERKQMFNFVVRPALALVGAIESNEAQNGRILESYTFVPAVEAARKGVAVPLFTPTDDGLKKVAAWWGRPPVVITLREAEHSPHRNSNIAEWSKFARYLRDELGERVIFIRDSAKASLLFEDFETCSPAAFDIGARVALYASAKCNLFVSNGPATLAFFMQRPWLMFCEPDEKDAYFPNTPLGWRTFAGIGPGEQFPWSTPEQRIVWSADVFETMRAAWEDLQGLLQAAA